MSNVGEVTTSYISIYWPGGGRAGTRETPGCLMSDGGSEWSHRAGLPRSQPATSSWRAVTGKGTRAREVNTRYNGVME